jgi:integrase
MVAVNDYLIDSRLDGRSQWRLDSLRNNFYSTLVPFFGQATPIQDITTAKVKAFVRQRKEQGRKPKTIWHDLINLSAFFNWASKARETEDGVRIAPLVRENPLSGVDFKIGSTRAHKEPLDLGMVERAAQVLTDPQERAYFDFLRFTGLRKDEANRVRWDDINFERGTFHVRGTKTAESDAPDMPLADVLIDSLLKLKAVSTSEYVFAGKRGKTKDKRVYNRKRMFEKIEQRTTSCNDCHGSRIANRRYCPACKRIEIISRTDRCSRCKSTNVVQGRMCTKCGSTNLSKGIHLKPKDMRDYFASVVPTNDVRVLMKLMRHTQLSTTTKYVRTMQDAMQLAVKDLGKMAPSGSVASLGATLGATQDSLRGGITAENGKKLHLAKMIEFLIRSKNTQQEQGSSEGFFEDGSRMLIHALVGKAHRPQLRSADTNRARSHRAKLL